MNINGKCLIIGLCGRSGAGKTTVCRTFDEFGIMSVDTDKVYRELTFPYNGTPSELVRAISNEFSTDVIFPDGSLDRRTLSGLVFGDGNGDKLKRLGIITHKAILERTEELICEFARKGARGVIVDAPALFESGFDKKCDTVICVCAPDEILIQRIMKRDSISEEDAKKRLSSMISEENLKTNADYVIVNDGLTDLVAETKRIAEKIFSDNGVYSDEI